MTPEGDCSLLPLSSGFVEMGGPKDLIHPILPKYLKYLATHVGGFLSLERKSPQQDGSKIHSIRYRWSSS